MTASRGALCFGASRFPHTNAVAAAQLLPCHSPSQPLCTFSSARNPPGSPGKRDLAGVKGPESIPASLLGTDPGKHPAQKLQLWHRQLPRALPRCWRGLAGLPEPREPRQSPGREAAGARCSAGLRGLPGTLPGNPGCNSRGAQPRGSEKKQITGQAPSILVKILSPAEPPRLPSLFQLAQRPGAPGAELPLMKRKHCRASKCRGRRVAPAGTADGPGGATSSRVAGWQC